MSAQDTDVLFERYATAFATHDAAAIAQLHAAETQFWLHTGGPPVRGRAAVHATFAELFDDWPQLGCEVVRLLTGDRHWVLEWVMTATPARPDGASRRVRLDCLDVVTLDEEGLVLRKDTYVDTVQSAGR